MSLRHTLLDHGAESVIPDPYFSPTEVAVLNQLGAGVYRIEDTASDTAAFSTRYAIEPYQCLNSILVQTKAAPGRVYSLLLVPATARLNNSTLKKALGGKTSFVPAERAYQLTGMAPGAITPIGLPDTIPIVLDTAQLTQASYIVGGKIRALKIELPATGLASLATVDFPGLYH